MAAYLHDACPVASQIMAILSKIGPVTEEDLEVFNIEKMEEEYNESPRSPASSKGNKAANELYHNKSFSKASLAKG